MAAYSRERASRVRVAALEPLLAIVRTFHDPTDRDRFELPALYRRYAWSVHAALSATPLRHPEPHATW